MLPLPAQRPGNLNQHVKKLGLEVLGRIPGTETQVLRSMKKGQLTLQLYTSGGSCLMALLRIIFCIKGIAALW